MNKIFSNSENRDCLSIRYIDGNLEVVDQVLLPHQEVWLRIKNPTDMVLAIKRLAVRGAPLIGVAAAMTMADYAKKGVGHQLVLKECENLRESRPTAVNLMNALDRCKMVYEKSNFNADILFREALSILDEDVRMCDELGEKGNQFVSDGDGILTHCNAGALATAGIGTALAVIKTAHRIGKKIQVFVDETRPLGQGARLTTWELEKEGISYDLICDNMAASLMAAGKVNKVFVGADRIAQNGDAANKIGTYGVAVLAKYHNVPFYIVAPSTTLDQNCPTGQDIPIEQRDPHEVRGEWAPRSASIWNPAFDVTPRELITGIILEDRVI